MTQDRNNDRAPWWSRSAWSMGPLAIGFLMLLAAVLGWLPQGLDKRAIPQRTEAIERVERMLESHTAQTDATNRLLRSICRHTAQSDAGKADCDR